MEKSCLGHWSLKMECMYCAVQIECYKRHIRAYWKKHGKPQREITVIEDNEGYHISIGKVLEDEIVG